MPVIRPSNQLPGEGSPPGAEAVRHGVAASGKRWYEFETVIDCPAADLWRAITEGDEIAKWFAPLATAEPGLGGKVWLSWGPGWEGAQKIAVWEPGRRMCLNHWRDPSQNDVAEVEREATQDASGPVPVAVEYIIEGRGGQTVLRIVQAGLGAGEEWDGEVDAISRGWRIFMSQLKHYLERHRGQPAVNVWVDRCVEALPGAWRKLIGPGSPVKFESLGDDGVPAVGSRCEIVGGGERVSGTIDFFGPSMEFGMVLDDPADGLLRYSVLNYGPWVGLGLFMVGYGDAVKRDVFEARATRLAEGVIAALGIGVDPPAAHPSYALMKNARGED